MLTSTASKVAAERAFWKFFEDNKVDFDGVACNPGAVSTFLLALHVPSFSFSCRTSSRSWLTETSGVGSRQLIHQEPVPAQCYG